MTLCTQINYAVLVDLQTRSCHFEFFVVLVVLGLLKEVIDAAHEYSSLTVLDVLHNGGGSGFFTQPTTIERRFPITGRFRSAQQ